MQSPQKTIRLASVTIRSCSRKICALLAAAALVIALSSTWSHVVRANPQAQRLSEPAASEPLVIQGRITAIEGDLVTVKTPNGYPGRQGGHAQNVTAGPTFRVDVSRARVLLPDGRRVDNVPLAVGDRVLMVLTGPNSSPPTPGMSQTYFVSIVERVAQSDKIVTH